MADTASRVLLFALVAAASPVALLATLAVLTSRRGRRNGIAYLGGFLAGQTIAFVTAVLIGSAASTNREETDQLAAALELAFGLFLLVLAWPERRHRSEPVGAGRMKGLIERLRGLRAWTAFAVGILLGVGVKRLSITIVAGASVGLAGLAPAEEAVLGALYVLVAGILVWAPVGAYLIAGERADRLMLRAEDWMTANGRRIAFFSTAFFGFLLTSDALVRLV